MTISAGIMNRHDASTGHHSSQDWNADTMKVLAQSMTPVLHEDAQRVLKAVVCAAAVSPNKMQSK